MRQKKKNPLCIHYSSFFFAVKLNKKCEKNLSAEERKYRAQPVFFNSKTVLYIFIFVFLVVKLSARKYLCVVYMNVLQHQKAASCGATPATATIISHYSATASI